MISKRSCQVYIEGTHARDCVLNSSGFPSVRKFLDLSFMSRALGPGLGTGYSMRQRRFVLECDSRSMFSEKLQLSSREGTYRREFALRTRLTRIELSAWCLFFLGSISPFLGRQSHHSRKVVPLRLQILQSAAASREAVGRTMRSTIVLNCPGSFAMSRLVRLRASRILVSASRGVLLQNRPMRLRSQPRVRFSSGVLCEFAPMSSRAFLMRSCIQNPGSVSLVPGPRT